MSAKLAAELMDAFNNAGGAVKEEDTHRMAKRQGVRALPFLTEVRLWQREYDLLHTRNMVLWRTSTPADDYYRDEFSFIQRITKDWRNARTVPLLWTGWYRNRSAVITITFRG